MYSVVWLDRAEDQLDELPVDIADRIVKKISSHLVKSPRQLGEAMVGEYSGCYRYRIGDYRIIYQIYDDKVYIMVIAVGHRKNVYDV